MLTIIVTLRLAGLFPVGGGPKKSLWAFTQPPMTLEVVVHLSAEAVVGIAPGHGIQLPVVRDEPLVQLSHFGATGTPPGSMSDAAGSFSVGLRSWFLPEDRHWASLTILRKRLGSAV